MYPSLIIEYGFYPPHLGKEFLEVYKGIKDERIEAKHNGNKLKNLTLKLSINGDKPLHSGMDDKNEPKSVKAEMLIPR